MFNLSSKYLKTVILVVTVYAVSQVFHRIQRHRYIAISLFATSEGLSGVATHKHLSSKDGCTIYFGKAEIFSLGDTTPEFPGDVACTP